MISIKNAYIFAFKTFKKNWILFLGICAVLFITSLIGNLGAVFRPLIQSQTLFIVVTLFFWGLYLVISAFFNAGFKSILLSLVAKKKVMFTDIIVSKKIALKYLVGQLFVFLIIFCIIFTVMFAMLSVVVPFGINLLYGQVIAFVVFIALLLVLASRFVFWPYIMLNQSTSALTALKMSKKMTQGHAKKVMLFFVLSSIVAVAGLILVSFVPVIKFVLMSGLLYLVISIISLGTVHLYYQINTLFHSSETDATLETDEGVLLEKTISKKTTKKTIDTVDHEIIVQPKEIDAPDVV